MQIPKDLVKIQILSLYVWGGVQGSAFLISYQACAPGLWDCPLRSKALHPHCCKGVLQDYTTSFSGQMRFSGQLVWETLHLCFQPGRFKEAHCVL